MKPAARSSTAFDARLLSWAALFVMSAGSFCVFRSGEDRLAERVAGNAQLAAQVRAGALAIKNEPSLRAAWRRIEGRAGTRAGSGGGDVAHSLDGLARVASRRHTAFAAIAASAATPTIAFDLTLEGRYADVLATIRELSTMRVAATIELRSISRKSLEAPDATVTASLHAALVPFAAGPAPPLPRAISLRRDPFRANPGIVVPPAADPATIPAGLMSLPPNAGAFDAAFPFAVETHVGALVTGSHAFALVYGNGISRMVTIGDRVNGARIRAIRDDGLLLENGTRVAIAGPAPPRPRSHLRLRRAVP